jgi:hypothetical protein
MVFIQKSQNFIIGMFIDHLELDPLQPLLDYLLYLTIALIVQIYFIYYKNFYKWSLNFELPGVLSVTAYLSLCLKNKDILLLLQQSVTNAWRPVGPIVHLASTKNLPQIPHFMIPI